MELNCFPSWNMPLNPIEQDNCLSQRMSLDRLGARMGRGNEMLLDSGEVTK